MVRNIVPVVAEKKTTPTSKQKPLDIATGEEALREVAKSDGRWNWCVLGPDPEKLPLVAGAFGRVEDVQAAIGSHPTVYGLVRLSFGMGDKMMHRWVSILASDKAENEAKKVSPIAQGKAAQKAPQMQAAFARYASTSASVPIRNKEECTADRLVEALLMNAAPSNDKITLEDHQKGVKELMVKFGYEAKEKVDAAAREIACQLLEERHEAQSASPEMEPEPPKPQKPQAEPVTRQRGKIKVPKLFDYVMVYSNTSKSWHDDGVVIEVSREASEQGGVKIPPGSIKVWYNHGKWLKWLTPALVGDYVKPSCRPKPPENFRGELKKETHNLITTWNVRYCVLSGGLLQWWMSEDEFNARMPENGSIALLGLRVSWAKDSLKKFSITSSGLKGVIYSFKAESDRIATLWADNLEKQAAFCEAFRKYYGKSKEKACFTDGVVGPDGQTLP